MRSLCLIWAVIAAVITFGLQWFFKKPPDDGGRGELVKRISARELRELEVKAVGDPVMHAYGYEHNEYRALPSLAGESLNTMNEGRLPVFGYEGFKFVVISKREDTAWGFAWGSGDPPQCPKSISFDPQGDGLWIWSLDLGK